MVGFGGEVHKKFPKTTPLNWDVNVAKKITHLKQRYPFSKIQLTKSKTKNIKNSNPINLIFQGVVLEGA